MPQTKRAILVVSFGTSHHQTREKNIDAIEQAIAEAFPNDAVRRAFTSGIIVRKLRERDNIAIDTVTEALEKLINEGFDTVVIQPTHILNGEEFEDIVDNAEPFRSRFSAMTFAKPLLTQTEDYQAVAGILSRRFPPQADTVVCLMGHGTAHYINASYAALDYCLRDIGRDDILVGTVEGFPDLDALLRRAKKSGAKRALLTPFMVVAGDHAVNDMAGDEEDSWKSVMEAAGYEVECLLQGLGEYPEVREHYVKHVRDAMESLGL